MSDIIERLKGGDYDPTELGKEIEALRAQVVELTEECNLRLGIHSETIDELAAMTQERDLKDSQVTKLYSNWTESQARINELHDLLSRFGVYAPNECQDEINKTIATPDDSSALDATLKPRGWWNPKYPTLAVQLTKPHDGGGWEPFYTAPEKVTSLESQLL